MVYAQKYSRGPGGADKTCASGLSGQEVCVGVLTGRLGVQHIILAIKPNLLYNITKEGIMRGGMRGLRHRCGQNLKKEEILSA